MKLHESHHITIYTKTNFNCTAGGLSFELKGYKLDKYLPTMNYAGEYGCVYIGAKLEISPILRWTGQS